MPVHLAADDVTPHERRRARHLLAWLERRWPVRDDYTIYLARDEHGATLYDEDRPEPACAIVHWPARQAWRKAADTIIHEYRHLWQYDWHGAQGVTDRGQNKWVPARVREYFEEAR